MSHRWRSAIRVLFAACFLFTALPLASPALADDATPSTTVEATEAAPTDVAAPTSAPATESVEPTGAPVVPMLTATIAANEVTTAAEADVVNLFVQKFWCEDNSRAGTTEFTFDFPPEFSSTAATSCTSQMSNAGSPDITLSLLNVDTLESYQQVLVDTLAYNFTDIPVGSYVLTETVEGNVSTSDLFELTPGIWNRVRILNYINESEHSGPSPEGTSDISGYFLTCTSPGRSGDVEFLISSMVNSASMPTCQVADAAGDLMLYGAQSADGPIDFGSGVPFSRTPDGFGLDGVANGYYALGFQAEGSNTPVFSDIFVASNGYVSVEINVYQEVAPTTSMDVWKDICVDPALDGQTRFFVNAEPNDVSSVSASSSVECRYAQVSDGPFTITLTNVDTEETQSDVILGSSSISFYDLVAGTYTLTEEHDGQFATSGSFTIDPSQSYYTYIRNYVAAQDWTPPTDESDEAQVFISGYVCVDPSRNGGAEYFHYTNVYFDADEIGAADAVQASDAGHTASTAQCREATEADGFEFVMYPVSDVSAAAAPITFRFTGGGSYETEDTIPLGQYVITEMTTGVSTDTLDILSNYHYVDFLVYQGTEPTVTPTEPTTPTVTATATATSPAQPTASATATETAKVTTLPKTGQGTSASSSSTTFLLLASLSLLILGAGVWLRGSQKKRS